MCRCEQGEAIRRFLCKFRMILPILVRNASENACLDLAKGCTASRKYHIGALATVS